MADGLTHYTFQPGLTTTVALAWQQEAGTPVPGELTVTIAAHTLRASSMDGSLGWRDAEPVAVVTLAPEPLDREPGRVVGPFPSRCPG
ncbi:MAG: hypothetical protein IPJ61_13815 [Tessaracoccus sp.]|uniref:hypothetical protein n=1 Tax=Tessaracoccus sp. TaxID=1971211 RepID=UPI001EB11358|nr:hypothetical protein [Tessaracoccus sp.]MBK7822102.1 hypothetical protein [Tessaracoccus sp.]